jgi:hypothetical protein
MRIVVLSAALVAGAAATAAVLARGDGTRALDEGPLRFSDNGISRWQLNPRRRPMLAESADLHNSGKQAVVLDRVRTLEATPGLRVVGAYVAWHNVRTVTKTTDEHTSGDFYLDTTPNLRPKAAGTTIAPGRFFSVELSERLTGKPAGWSYRRLQVDYHVGPARYRRTIDVKYRYTVCRIRACVEAFRRRLREGRVAPP